VPRHPTEPRHPTDPRHPAEPPYPAEPRPTAWNPGSSASWRP